MHELAITRCLVDLVRERVVSPRRVTEVEVEVGALTGISPDCLQFYFECLTRDGPMAGARLVCRNVPARVRCRACGTVYEAPDLALTCRACSVAGGDVVAGNELHLVRLEVLPDV